MDYSSFFVSSSCSFVDNFLIQIEPRLDCENCSTAGARRYQTFTFQGHGEPIIEEERILCVRCARAERKLRGKSDAGSEGLTRQQLIAHLDVFFETSGVFEICRRCHRQGTGCCPPSCRVMGRTGCDPKNRYGKTVFCTAFICGALLNAITECDPEVGRELKWIKRELGPVEFHLFEMITRAPYEVRDPVRPLHLPQSYPVPKGLDCGSSLRQRLLALTDEILEIRRRWSAFEKTE